VTARVCLLGFGEVGQTLAGALRSRVSRVSAWDLAFADANSGPARAAPRLDVVAARDAAGAVAGADLVISAVTAAQIGPAAESLAPHLPPGCWYLDLNSTSPAAKRAAAELVEGAGGRFVEAAIMSPIHPHAAASPMLIGGPRAAGFQPLAADLGFTATRVIAGELGAASAAKMCRSVLVKGLEALMLESLLSARRHGVEDVVFESLENVTLDDWRRSGQYMMSRALLHGARRAEEMREVARTVSEAGLTPHMSSASAAWQEWAGARAAQASEPELTSLLDRLLERDSARETR
jgi:3-hydroxyisobutyrate dehydrogenase-like beta-hydroxyacid dehydrogenase